MRNFIEEYKNMPELWNIKSDKYKNKNVRRRSYEKLLIEYKKNKRDATVDDLKKKISNMRTCYRRELKKYIQSQRSGAGVDEIHVPSLWYFDSLNFLRDLEMPLPGRSNLSSDDDLEIIPTPTKPIHQNKSKKICALDIRTEFLKKATEHFEFSKNKENADDASIYASGWACMLRQMESYQQLFAKQAIDEILLLGRMKKLSLNFLHNAEYSMGFISQDLSQDSFSSSVVNDPLLCPTVSSNSVQFVPETQYNSVRELFSSSQFQ